MKPAHGSRGGHSGNENSQGPHSLPGFPGRSEENEASSNGPCIRLAEDQHRKRNTQQNPGGPLLGTGQTHKGGEERHDRDQAGDWVVPPIGADHAGAQFGGDRQAGCAGCWKSQGPQLPAKKEEAQNGEDRHQEHKSAPAHTEEKESVPVAKKKQGRKGAGVVLEWNQGTDLKPPRLDHGAVIVPSELSHAKKPDR